MERALIMLYAPLLPRRFTSQRQKSPVVGLLRFAGISSMLAGSLLGVSLLLGCGGSGDEAPASTVVQEDPKGEFEWGMKRLDRALKLFRPGGSEGLRVTDRKLDYQVFPPDANHDHYTARVTVMTEAAFLHGKRKLDEEAVAAKPEEGPKIDDPLDDKTDELNKLVDLPGAGPQAPASAPARIETRSLENTSVFELAYLDSRWQLTEKPELKHEESWFDYAFGTEL